MLTDYITGVPRDIASPIISGHYALSFMYPKEAVYKSYFIFTKLLSIPVWITMLCCCLIVSMILNKIEKKINLIKRLIDIMIITEFGGKSKGKYICG